MSVMRATLKINVSRMHLTVAKESLSSKDMFICNSLFSPNIYLLHRIRQQNLHTSTFSEGRGRVGHNRFLIHIRRVAVDCYVQ